MKKLVISSIVAWSSLFGNMIVPDISMMNSCQERDKISQLEPEADIASIQNWFEKASSADENNNKSLMVSLTNNRTSYKMKKNIMYLKHSVRSKECIQKVTHIENTFDVWTEQMRAKLKEPVYIVEDTPPIDTSHIKIVAPAPKHVAPTIIDDSYYSYQSNSSNLYIVSTKVGVNVRENPLMGKKSKVIDSIAYGTGLILKEDVRINDNEKWGQFVYQKNGSKHIGWIHMSYVKQSK